MEWPRTVARSISVAGVKMNLRVGGFGLGVKFPQIPANSVATKTGSYRLTGLKTVVSHLSCGPRHFCDWFPSNKVCMAPWPSQLMVVYQFTRGSKDGHP